MLFNQAKFLFALVALLALMTTVLSVNLHQHTRPNCHGKRASCTRLHPRVCCKSPRNFASGSCQGCTSTDFHLTWNSSGRKSCGRNAKSTNGGRCLSGNSNLRGHSWCRLCRTKREEDGESATCTSSVEPSVLEIGTKWFQLNDTMTVEHKDALWDLWHREAEDADVQEHLLAYQGEMPSEEEGMIETRADAPLGDEVDEDPE